MEEILEKSDGFVYVEKQIRIPSFQMGYEHIHSYYEIYYLKSGLCTYTVNNKKYHLKSGDIFIVAPGDSHSTYYEGSLPCERVAIYCRLEQFLPVFWANHQELKDKFHKTSRVVLKEADRPCINAILDMMIHEKEQTRMLTSEIMDLLLCQLLLSIDRSGIFVYECLDEVNDHSADIDQALRYIDLNYRQPITLEEVADKINLTPTYLSRKFKKITGVTFKEYLTRIRIRQASQLLLTTDDSITKIAIDCGFNSSNYFKDSFKKISGVSPRTFRKNDRTFNFENLGINPAPK